MLPLGSFAGLVPSSNPCCCVPPLLDSACRALTCWTPHMNILRDPRWGRGSETWGEDPHLSSVMAAHVVRGLQGEDPIYVKVGAHMCVCVCVCVCVRVCACVCARPRMRALAGAGGTGEGRGRRDGVVMRSGGRRGEAS
jgi:hypothetical protein